MPFLALFRGQNLVGGQVPAGLADQDGDLVRPRFDAAEEPPEGGAEEQQADQHEAVVTPRAAGGMAGRTMRPGIGGGEPE
jgi:hypothetical protein